MALLGSLLADSKRQLKAMLSPLVRSYGGPATGLPPSRWGLTHEPSGGLSLEGVPLEGLRARFGSPLHVVQASKVRGNARRFRAVPKGGEKGCEVFYSYKSNPVPGVLRLLHGEGVGAEVISAYEFWLARRMGVPASAIVYNGPVKSEASVREALEAGVGLFNVNHAEELLPLARLAKQVGCRPRVGVRVSTGEGWAAQFGVPIAGGAALAAFQEAIGSGVLEVVGLHAHRGGMIHSETQLLRFVDAVLAFTDELKARLDLDLEILDLGGSLGTPTVCHLSEADLRLNRTFQRDLRPPNADDALSIERYLELLVGRVEGHCRASGRQRPRIFLEPGRALTGDTQLLLATVHSVKEEGETSYAILDAGINLAESVRSEYHQLLPVSCDGQPPNRLYVVVGPICSPGDTLYASARLPELHPGDALAIMDAGAYFVPFATSFSFPQPAIVLQDGGEVRLLRRAERFEDLAALDEDDSATALAAAQGQHQASNPKHH